MRRKKESNTAFQLILKSIFLKGLIFISLNNVRQFMDTNDAEHLFHSICNEINGAEKGKLFGKLCYKIEKKAFVCFFQNEMVFKLNGHNHTMAMKLSGAHLFDPSGKNRPMKEWVQVPFTHHNEWSPNAHLAANYIKEMQQ